MCAVIALTVFCFFEYHILDIFVWLITSCLVLGRVRENWRESASKYLIKEVIVKQFSVFFFKYYARTKWEISVSLLGSQIT